MAPTPWGPTTHEWLSSNDNTRITSKVLPVDDYERARLCVNALAGISDATILGLKPGEIRDLLRKKIKTAVPALFDKGDEAHGSDHRRAVNWWCDSWSGVYEVNWPFDGGKDGKIIKELLRICGGLSEFCQAVNRYMGDSDEFVVKQRHSLGMFRSQIQRWIVAQVPVKTSADPIAESMARMRSQTGGGQ